MAPLLFRHNRPGRCVTFDEYRSGGGFTALTRALQELSPLDVQQLVMDSKLRGRGGAGFPTGLKWSFVPRNLPGPRWLICNCDEMEPGTYKDRVLLEANPYSLVEGITPGLLCSGGPARLHLHPARLRERGGEPAPGGG